MDSARTGLQSGTLTNDATPSTESPQTRGHETRRRTLNRRLETVEKKVQMALDMAMAGMAFQAREVMPIGRLVQTCRVARGMDRVTAARACGLSVEALRSIENGRRVPRPETVAKLHHGLRGASLSDWAAVAVVTRRKCRMDRRRQSLVGSDTLRVF